MTENFDAIITELSDKREIAEEFWWVPHFINQNKRLLWQGQNYNED